MTAAASTKISQSVADARNHLPELVHQAERGEVVEITRRGKPVAVLLSVPEYERLTGCRQSYWDAYQRWRREAEAEGLDGIDELVDEMLAHRDRSPGRDVHL
jgi:prevent-host-death family protein